jgi:hypothetical protein
MTPFRRPARLTRRAVTVSVPLLIDVTCSIAVAMGTVGKSVAEHRMQGCGVNATSPGVGILSDDGLKSLNHSWAAVEVDVILLQKNRTRHLRPVMNNDYCRAGAIY